MTPTTLDDRSLGWLRYLHRKATPPDDWSRTGVASGNRISVRAVAAILVGHARHHAGVLHERYGIAG